MRIKAVYRALGPLCDEVVFVGGATVSLYADRKTAEVRPTDDIDILIELWAYKDYAAVEEQLRKMGFVNDIESGIICRYKVEGIIVDVMPTGNDILNFGNAWYPDGYRMAVNFRIDNEDTVKIFSSAYFIASKLEAFKNPNRRDNNNGIYSHDFEDIIYILENRFSVWEELENSPYDVKFYLKAEFTQLLNNILFEEWVDAHAGYGSPPATYYILEKLSEVVSA